MERVIAYVDGHNVYHGLCAKKLRKLLWLDIDALMRSLLKPTQTLEAVKYFTARVSRPLDKVRRQSIYIDAIASTGVEVIEGKYQNSEIDCKRCGRTWTDYEEKQTDVNIAVAMMTDAHLNRFDMALLVSGDSDLTPPTRRIPDLHPEKRIVVASPPGRHSMELSLAAGASFTISPNKVRKAQFPDEVATSSGFILKRPETWPRGQSSS